jgi:parallel beta-helix repeat protein
MKTLEEINDAICAIPTNVPQDKVDIETCFVESNICYIISSPGSYYLSSSLLSGGVPGAPYTIVIRSGNVDLDLNGFRVNGSRDNNGMGCAILIDTPNETVGSIYIHDGTLLGESVVPRGIYVLSSQARIILKNLTLHGFKLSGICTVYGVTVHNSQALENGTGFSLGENSIVIGCVAKDNSSIAIFTKGGSIIDHCVAVGNGDGIVAYGGSVVSGCSVVQNFSASSASGISVGEGSLVVRCTVSDNSSTNASFYFNGIEAQSYSTVRDCVVKENDGDGIKTDDDSLVVGNLCSGNGADKGNAGILVMGHDCRIEGNNCTDNGYGIKVDGNGNFIVKNTASGNTTNYLINTGSHYRISTSLTGADAWDNFEF